MTIVGRFDAPKNNELPTCASTSGRKRTINAKKKATPQDGFSNAFGNKDVVSLQTLVIPIGMAERAGFEPAVGLTLRTLSRRVT
jgi:hypothetical protein